MRTLLDDRHGGAEADKGDPLSIQAREETLVRLWSDAPSVKAEAMHDTLEGRWIDREMQRATNRWMLFLVFLTFFPPFFIIRLPAAMFRYSFSMIILGLALSAAFIVAVIIKNGLAALSLRLACFGAAGLKRAKPLTRASVSQVVNSVLNGEADNITGKRLTRWMKWEMFSPFHFKFVWWWILLFGLCSVHLEHAAYMGKANLSEEIESRIMVELGISLLKVLIVSVIAFIATNVLREVLALRERYSANLSQAQQLSERLSLLRTSIDQIQPLSTQMYEVLTNSVRVLGLSNRLAEFTKRDDGRNSHEQEASVKFLERIRVQVDNFLDQIAKAEDERAKPFVLGVLTGLLEGQRQLLNTNRRRIMARFSDLALLGKELVDSSFPKGMLGPGDVEFYGLMVLPPQRFLNNGRGRLKGEASEIEGDKNWETYLEGNRDSAARGVRQTRFFLSVDGKSKIDEVSDIERVRVENSLSRWVAIDEKGVPRKTRNEAGEWHYVIEREPPENGEGTWKKLADVLGSIYHAPDCCKIREFDEEEYRTELVDRTRQKPLDYFAVRHSNEWIFCLQTLYDKDLDAADIELFYADSRNSKRQENWEQLKEKLNMIFFNPDRKHGSIYRIEDYVMNRGSRSTKRDKATRS